MIEAIKALNEENIPVIIIVAGILFMLLSVAERVSGHLSVPPSRKKQALYLGLILFVVGIGMYSAPALMATNSTNGESRPAPEDPPEGTPGPGAEMPDWDDMDWDDLNKDQKSLWSELGWTQERWDNDEPPESECKAFDALTSEQQKAASQLGYNAGSWGKCD